LAWTVQLAVAAEKGQADLRLRRYGGQNVGLGAKAKERVS
jgi:hypothetical protein